MRRRPRRPQNSHGLAKRSLNLEPLEQRHLLTATPLITELMAANDGVLVDEDGDNSDWIELANAGDTTADLTGWYLTDSSSNLTKWQLPAISLDPDEYLVVFASSKDRAVSGDELHTNFSLSSDGEFLALVEPDGATIASQYAPGYPAQLSNVSYGMRTSGGVVFEGDLRFFSPATPGTANDEGYLGVVATPVFSVPHGFYNSLQNVSITSSTPGAVIRYTLDGSTPTDSNGTVYTAPLAVSEVTVLRAGAILTNYLPSRVETQTYLFVNDVLSQAAPDPTWPPPPPAEVGPPAPPPGYPANWGTAPAFPTFGLPPYLTPADYALDPEIVDAPAYAADFLAGLTAIPTVSVVMNIDDLFGAAGIYSNPWERGDLWERATSIELINPDGSPGFQVDAGMRILGNASRQPMLSPKHSLRIEMRSQYGESELNYPLFENSSVATFDSFVLRANLSDSWVSPQGDAPVLTFIGSQGRPRAQYARDNYARDLQLAMGQLAPQSNYVHVYINGLYWGLHDLIERRDGDFVASHLGGAPQDYDVLQDDVFEDSGMVVEGDTVAWDAMFALANAGLANEAQYLQMQQYLDIEKFIDYMNLHLYVGSQDWPYNNWTAVRKREPAGTFAFLIWDAEYTLHDPMLNRTFVNDAQSPGQLFFWLRTNADFRMKFADRAHHFMFNGGLLTPDAAWDRYEALVSQLDDAIVAESARWGDYRKDVHRFLDDPYELSTRDNQWNTEFIRLRDNYFPVRTNNVLDQYRAIGLYPNVVAPTFNQHGGEVPSSFELTITAPAGTIYYTLDGSDPIDYSGGALDDLEYDGPVELAPNTRVNARVNSGGVWSALNTALFTIAVPKVRITELMYHPAAPPPGDLVDKEEFEFIEILNVDDTTVNLENMVLSVAVDFTFPNVNLPPGAYALIVENQVAFESRYGTGFTILGEYSGKLNNAGEQVVLVDEFFQTIHDFTYDDAWYPTTDGDGYSLVIRDHAAGVLTWSQAASWRPSRNLFGSPGALDDTPPDVDLDGAGGTLGFTSSWNNLAAVNITDTDATVTDVDSTNLASLTATLAVLHTGDQLSADPTGTLITVSYDSGTGVLTLSNSDTLANYQTVLRTIKYHNTSGGPGVGSKTINIVGNDGVLTSPTAVATVNVTSPFVDLNGAPAGTARSVTWTGAAVVIADAATALVIDTANITSLTATIPVAQAGDSLSATVTGTTVSSSYNAAGQVLTLSLGSSVAQYQQVLRTIKYSNSVGGPSVGSFLVNFVANDGVSLSNTAVGTVIINVAPRIDLNGNQIAGGNNYTTTWANQGVINLPDPYVAIAFNGQGTSLSSLTASIVSPVAGDVLATNTSGTGISASYNATSGVLTMTNANTATNYQNVLRRITYNNTSGAQNVTSKTVIVVGYDGATVSPTGVAATITIQPLRLDLNGDALGTGYNTFWSNAGAVTIEGSAGATAATLLDGKAANLTSLTVTLGALHAGDFLDADVTGTGIAKTYAAGVLFLSNSDTIANYQTVLRSIKYDNTSGGPGVALKTINYLATNSLSTTSAASSTVQVVLSGAQVVGRQLFYNQSGTGGGTPRYDGNNAAITASDDNAIALDKVAYIPGTGAATFANVSSFSKGINGIMLDLAGTHGSIEASDFIFRTGNNNAPSSWAAAPAPSSISVRAGAGVGGSDRIEIIWTNNAIDKEWLQVVMSTDAGTGTGLSQLAGYTAGYGDVFYFGNAVGDSGLGNASTNAIVDVTDELEARNHAQSLTTAHAIPSTAVLITNIRDYDRNGSVELADNLIARNNPTSGTIPPNPAIRFLNLAAGSPPNAPEGDGGGDGGGGGGVASALTAPSSSSTSSSSPTWLVNSLASAGVETSSVGAALVQLCEDDDSDGDGDDQDDELDLLLADLGHA